jgi:hypothetical protein
LIDFPNLRGKSPPNWFLILHCYRNAGSELILFAASCACDDILGMSFILKLAK